MGTASIARELLTATGREGILDLILDLEAKGFFTSPASTNRHSCYQGGLVTHSLAVQGLLVSYNISLGLRLSTANISIAGLLHDLCKMGSYLGNSKPYIWNDKAPPGHAMLSLRRIKSFITLEEIEERLILYHMGIYGLKEFSSKGEYSLFSLVRAWDQDPAVKVMYFCDEIATLEEVRVEARLQTSRYW